jgi:protease IV
MSKKTLWVFGIILAVLVVFLAMGLLSLYLLTRPGKIEVRQNSVLEISVDGEIPEFPSTSPFAKIAASDSLNIIELRRLLGAAAKDSHISAVYLAIHPLANSWAQVEEIRDFIQQFRKSKKKVHAHLVVDMASEKELYLASAADEIYLNPDAGLIVNGLVAEIGFYKKMMAKLKIEPQFLQFKEYKSAENFTREKMTPEFRSMLESILTDIQGRFIRTVASERKIDAARLRQIINKGMAPARLALQEHLVTALGYEDEIQSRLLTDKVGGGKEYRSINASKYLKSLPNQSSGATRQRVALIAGLGPIISGSSDEMWERFMGGETMAGRLRQIREDKDIKGVLFRVDSPGGSAVGSDKVWREVRLLEKEGKPVVVSMAGVAGSGGYYISMGARKIVAQPSTLTGSIGVIFGKFNLRCLYEDWLGITTDQIKLAENADIFSPVHSLTEPQKEQIRSWMEEIYNNFVRKAAEGRGMTFADLEPKAHGRIYTGAQAQKLKLIDQLGGLSTAVSLLKKELKVPESDEIELVLFPKPKSLWQSLAEGDLFKVSTPVPSLDSFLKTTLQRLETPAPWLITPEVTIH